ncbi:MAG: hypothetical protein GQ542_20955 [Desulforhopalus sp.]|nr:hypothetical protein [Desulforhopalus sp.]
MRLDIEGKKNHFLKDRQAEKIVNLKGHLTETICLTNNDCLVSVIKLIGTPYDNKTPNQLTAYKKRISNVIRSLNDPRYALWGSLLRRKHTINWHPSVANEYSIHLAQEYLKNIDRTLLENHYYLAIGFRVFPQNAATSLFRKKDNSLFQQMIGESLSEFQDKCYVVLANLS